MRYANRNFQALLQGQKDALAQEGGGVRVKGWKARVGLRPTLRLTRAEQTAARGFLRPQLETEEFIIKCHIEVRHPESVPRIISS